MEPEHAQKYRKVIKEVLLGNKISAVDCQKLALASSLAGARGVEDLSKAGSSGSRPGNVQRDMMNTILKESDYPEYYWADIPLHDPKLHKTVIVKMPFLLPHEVMQALHNNNKLQHAKSSRTTCTKGIWGHLQKAASLLSVAPGDLFALGIHGDGTPCGAKESLEQLSWSLPSWQGSGYGLRFLMFSVLKEFVAKGETWNAVFEVIAWSFKCLFAKTWPETRHDNSPWTATDANRSQLTGSMSIHGVLCHARGDWSFFKEVFNFPAWNCKDAMCWMCSASKETMTDFSLSAPWRHERRFG